MSKTNKNKEDGKDANNTDNEFAGDKFTDITEVESVPNSEDGMPEDKIKSLVEKFITLKKDALLEIANDYPKKKSLIVDYSELFKFNAQLCDELIDFPDKVIRIFEEVVNEQNIPVTFAGEVKFHVRFILPKGFTLKIRDVTSEYINKFFCVDGVITRVSDVLPKVYVGVFQCPICGKRKDVYQEKNRNLIVPSVCDDCKKAVRFKLLPEESKFIDIQRLEVQEPLEMLRGGEEARKIEIWLTDDLTGKVLPGNTIEVTGVMKLIPPKDINDAVYRKFIDANNINVIDREFTEVDLSEDDIKKINEFAKSPNIAEKFVSSISPTIYGYKEIKEAMALQLFGGSKFKLPDKTKTRGETHLLLIGDPGVAKSKLLIGASNIAPKSIYVSGKGTSAAGLTATAEKDEFAEGAWVLKAGALVLASGGIACVDEFDKMEKEDRAAMHEALEQQTISIAKAGIVAKFRAETCVLAAANPKFGRFSSEKAITDQFDIPPALLSRFDLIFPLRDIMDNVQDQGVANYVLKAYSGKKEELLIPPIDIEFIRKYIAYARKNLNPVVGEYAQKQIEEYYLRLRRESSKDVVQITARQLEGIIRLSCASAKMRLKNVVEKEDVDRAIRLIEYSLNLVARDKETGKIDVDRVTQGPREKRDKIKGLSEILGYLTENGKKHCLIEDFVKQAKEQGIDEKDAKNFVENAKREGKIFEPKDGEIGMIE
ncbi:Minichromosome maintenance protein MCM [groundwater metagenome]|uniref:DNA helicase n=1 Tax=groundwater metagenome TaxID=717931 RepID=A0A098EAT8_9ZZZZ